MSAGERRNGGKRESYGGRMEVRLTTCTVHQLDIIFPNLSSTPHLVHHQPQCVVCLCLLYIPTFHPPIWSLPYISWRCLPNLRYNLAQSSSRPSPTIPLLSSFTCNLPYCLLEPGRGRGPLGAPNIQPSLVVLCPYLSPLPPTPLLSHCWVCLFSSWTQGNGVLSMDRVWWGGQIDGNTTERCITKEADRIMGVPLNG